MAVPRISRGMVVGAMCMVFGAIGFAGTSFSFTGSFTQDDQLQQFVFMLSGPATITATTFSYAGGTNQAGTIVPEGGFDPWLAIFDASGNLQASNDNGTCGQVNSDSMTGSCFDSFISESFAAGAYTLVLSESDNQPAGTTLAAGYTRTGQGNFTSADGCSNGMFCDVNGFNRTPEWEVDLDNVTSVGGVPEPSTLLLVLGGLAGVVLRRRGMSAAAWKNRRS